MRRTSIEWTDYSVNPLAAYDRGTGKRGWGRVKISPGCANCYAERLNLRLGTQQEFTIAGADAVRLEVAPEALRQMRRAPGGSLTFVCDMTDLFHAHVSLAQVAEIWAAMASSRGTFQVLTKRPQVARRYLGNPQFQAMVRKRVDDPRSELPLWMQRIAPLPWPLPNVWLGTSVESEGCAEWRIAQLLETPAALRFLSCEPLLERVVLYPDLLEDIDWVILGGESGPQARPCEAVWIANAVRECQDVGVPVFVKQLGTRARFTGWLPLPGESPAPERLQHAKGGDMDEWPSRLRVREFPPGWLRTQTLPRCSTPADAPQVVA